MRFKQIPAERFAEFHNSFLGDTLATFEVCNRCEGACEYNKIGTLMPGEREYMAQTEGLSVKEFSEKYLDTLVMKDGMELDVLRLIDGCPFLDRVTYRCNCREYKVVLCEIYPVAFHVRGGEVEFEIDDWCPLSDTLPFRHYFQEVGVSAVKRLQVPVAWYEYVAEYDDRYFDYKALQGCGRDPAKLQVFTLEELLRFQRKGQEHDPVERFHPYPSKVNRRPSEPGGPSGSENLSGSGSPSAASPISETQLHAARGKNIATIPGTAPRSGPAAGWRPLLPVIK